jgi:hypothetical protein
VLSDPRFAVVVAQSLLCHYSICAIVQVALRSIDATTAWRVSILGQIGILAALSCIG